MLLNTILCGPILRRIEPKRVCIWLATSIKPEDIKTRIMPLESGGKAGKPMMWLPADLDLAVKTKFNYRQAGKNLFIILLEVIPAGGGSFSVEKLYAYDIIFTHKKNTTLIIDGKTLTLTTDKKISFAAYYNKDNSYSYANIGFPAFVIPDKNKPNSRILYGSCRRTNGPGSDALNAADTHVEKSWAEYYTDSKKIPNFSLFHLGDQLYTDDLSEEIFNYTSQLCGNMMGYQEKIPAYPDRPLADKNDLIRFLDFYLKGVKGYNIEDLNYLSYIDYSKTNKQANVALFLKKYFSTNYEMTFPPAYARSGQKEIQSYLQGKMQMGELVNTLFKLSGTSNSKIDLDEILPPQYMLRQITTTPRIVTDIKYKNRKEFVKTNCSFTTTDDGHLLSFGEFAALYLINWGNPVTQNGISSKEEILVYKNKKVKRLLANVPSYMTFDDHDITDDWNCDATWKKRVENSETGKRVISNGLAAYLFFQAWGNDPDTFADNKLLNTVTDHLQQLLIKKTDADKTKANKYETSLWYFKNWAFVAPTNPIAVFLDSRTMRYQEKKDMEYFPAYNKNRKFKGARLISPQAFDQVAGLIKAAAFKAGDPIIFCAATPIISAPLSHRLQIEMVDGDFNKKYTVVVQGDFKKPGRYVHDWELWYANTRGKFDFFNFIDTKIAASQVFILSGDVHYAFHASLNLESYPSRKKYQIEQLTSSALKNNTLSRQQQINKLANFSLDLDTKNYHRIDESYPTPDSPKNPAPVHFKLQGKLQKYSYIIDKDSLLIPYNNAGLIEFQKSASFASTKKVLFENCFLYSPNFNGPVTKSRPEAVNRQPAVSVSRP